MEGEQAEHRITTYVQQGFSCAVAIATTAMITASRIVVRAIAKRCTKCCQAQWVGKNERRRWRDKEEVEKEGRSTTISPESAWTCS